MFSIVKAARDCFGVRFGRRTWLPFIGDVLDYRAGEYL